MGLQLDIVNILIIKSRFFLYIQNCDCKLFHICVYSYVYMQICRSEGRVRDLTYDHSLTAKMMLYLVYPLFILLLSTCLAQVAVVLQKLSQLLGMNWNWRSMPSYCYCSLWACNSMWLYSKENMLSFLLLLSIILKVYLLLLYCNLQIMFKQFWKIRLLKKAKHKIIVDCWTFMITMAFFSDFLILVLLIICILYITLLLFI